ncbi:MAG: hypothetical protein U0326_34445 [Polyangiales bacterium]
MEGEVSRAARVVIRESRLRRIVAPQGTYFRVKGEWSRGADVVAKPEGGQPSAVRPPTEDERRAARNARGKLGAGVDGREDKHLLEIPALIDPRQFELITRPRSGIVAIQGGAGSGKTTIGLHRMAWLALNYLQALRARPHDGRGVQPRARLYIVRVLPALGVEGVHVATFSEWIARRGQRHILEGPRGLRRASPPSW